MKKCDKNMTFNDCELMILRNAIDEGQEQIAKKKVNAPEIKEIMAIMESFIKEKKLICYGGTAINNILPVQDQFYNKDLEIPDYDCFSDKAMENAKQLADLYYRKGFTEVEAKAGQHYGTYKVFVNYIPVADLTYLVPEIYDNMRREVIKVDGILYAPPNFLRMSMYLELSRPEGDINRWEKILKRLVLLNKYYPLRGRNCKNSPAQRIFEEPTPTDLRTLSDMSLPTGNDKESSVRSYTQTASKTASKTKTGTKSATRKRQSPLKTAEKYNYDYSSQVYFVTRDSMIDQGVVFFGGFANAMFSRYMPKKSGYRVRRIPDFDVLSTDPLKTATIVKERLEDSKAKNVEIVKHSKIGELIAPHYEVRVGKDTVAFIYEPIACHSYNVIKLKGRLIKIATIDTMLSFYLAFYYVDRPYYDKNRILCMSEYLFQVQQKNRLRQRGLLKRFSLECYGNQPTIEDIRAEKTRKYKELKGKKDSKEYNMWFLRYIPAENQEKKNGKPRAVPKGSNSKNLKTKTARSQARTAKARRERIRKNAITRRVTKMFGF